MLLHVSDLVHKCNSNLQKFRIIYWNFSISWYFIFINFTKKWL